MGDSVGQSSAGVVGMTVPIGRGETEQLSKLGTDFADGSTDDPPDVTSRETKVVHLLVPGLPSRKPASIRPQSNVGGAVDRDPPRQSPSASSSPLNTPFTTIPQLQEWTHPFPPPHPSTVSPTVVSAVRAGPDAASAAPNSDGATPYRRPAAGVAVAEKQRRSRRGGAKQ